MKQNRWTNPEGKAQSRISIVAEHVEFKKRLTVEEKKEGTEDTAPSDLNELDGIKKANQASISEEIQEEVPEEALVF